MDVKDIISDYLVVFLAQIAAGKVDENKMYELGMKGGKIVTDNCRAQLGSNWNNLENVLENKVGALLAGFNDGLNYDEKGL